MFQNFIPNARPRAFCQPYDGQFEILVNENTPGARARVNKQGKTVWGIATKTIYGFIISASKTETAYGAALDIVFESADGQSELFLRLTFDSALAAAFLNRASNIDFRRPVYIDIAKKDGRASLFLKYADGRGIPYAYTRENPGGRPEWQKITRGDGAADWDNSAQLAFFAELLNTEIAERIHAAVNVRYAGALIEAERAKIPNIGTVAERAATSAEIDTLEYDNDLPF